MSYHNIYAIQVTNQNDYIEEANIEDITFPMDYRLEFWTVRQLSWMKAWETRSALWFRLANSWEKNDQYDISYTIEVYGDFDTKTEDWKVAIPKYAELWPNEEIYLNIEVSAPDYVVDEDEIEIVLHVQSKNNSYITWSHFGIIRITENTEIDTDKDGIPDIYEIKLWYDPYTSDNDNDWLIDSLDPDINVKNKALFPEKRLISNIKNNCDIEIFSKNKITKKIIISKKIIEKNNQWKKDKIIIDKIISKVSDKKLINLYKKILSLDTSNLKTRSTRLMEYLVARSWEEIYNRDSIKKCNY
jgi:hypothetical protein